MTYTGPELLWPKTFELALQPTSILRCTFLFLKNIYISNAIYVALLQFLVPGHKNLGISVALLWTLMHAYASFLFCFVWKSQYIELRLAPKLLCMILLSQAIDYWD